MRECGTEGRTAMRPIDGDALADVLTAISGIKVDTGRADKEWAVTLSAAKNAIAQMPIIKPKKGKLVAIKDIDMPPCCGDCPCFHESSAYTCGATGELLPDVWAWKCRSEACPLVEVEEWER